LVCVFVAYGEDLTEHNHRYKTKLITQKKYYPNIRHSIFDIFKLSKLKINKSNYWQYLDFIAVNLVLPFLKSYQKSN